MSDVPLVDPSAVADRVARLEAELHHRSGGRTRLLAVTKGFPPTAVAAAADAGLTAVGENYAQELLAKQAAGVGGDLAWHLLGAVQRNKVRRLAGRVALWQTVDRPELVVELAARAPGAAILIQVDPAGSAGKHGCSPAAVEGLVTQAGEAGLAVRGLMSVGVAGDVDATRRAFETTVGLADRLGLPERSMGMTDDLEVAVDCGSTMVRVGRAIFGDRPTR
jgi:hypothetical protein